MLIYDPCLYVRGLLGHQTKVNKGPDPLWARKKGAPFHVGSSPARAPNASPSGLEGQDSYWVCFPVLRFCSPPNKMDLTTLPSLQQSWKWTEVDSTALEVHHLNPCLLLLEEMTLNSKPDSVKSLYLFNLMLTSWASLWLGHPLRRKKQLPRLVSSYFMPSQAEPPPL